VSEPDVLVRGGTGRTATTIELFFDLVYVFAITQVVGVVHSDPSPAGLAKGAFILFLLWWTWTTYTWTTNWSGTDSAQIKLFLLTTMATTLVMALAVPGAFDETSALFGWTYFLVRLLASGLYWFESKDFPAQRAAFWTFFPISSLAAGLVLAGSLTGGDALVLLYLAGGILDFFAALNAGRGTWAVDAPHFAERNGLFIIISLGESIVAIGVTAVDVELDAEHLGAMVIAFAGVATLWWAYFDRAARYAERYFTTLTGKALGRFARDVYSYIHYPIVVGIVMFAVGLEEVVAHPDRILGLGHRLTLAGGTALVFAAIVAGTYRAIRRVTAERVVAVFALIAIMWVGRSWSALAFAGFTVAIAAVSLIAERTHPWPQPQVTAGGR
jgi:low temperature requirement protein LtrA